MNVPFVTGDKELDAKFVKEAKAAGLENLKGHQNRRWYACKYLQCDADMKALKHWLTFMKKFEEAESVDVQISLPECNLAECGLANQLTVKILYQ